MKKTLILTALIMVVASGGLFAKGLDFQFGGGYNGFFISDEASDFNGYPVGFAAFGGVGYKFLPTLSVGAEYEFSMDWAFNVLGSDQTMTMIEHLPKAYIKFNALNILAITGLAGVDIQTPMVDNVSGTTETAFTAGARVALLFAYAQYLMVFNTDRVDHRISVGIVLSK
ncbi:MULTISPECIES: hypothetical protein [unclassified Oceanispirochaeta]|uniref:hypothetical protein n=1 Tax=unclassified Oceanispirochaeta TaxID=2635722 RepID=UPI000E098CA2|nr:MULTISPECIES: hypothetical protein [unclassified Oceanispirochaeta]MBF9014073.1 hypothetical protein [Oceanispirochaeta sp. M2]NPD70564.1 hypothetical protein [Oceanispirochaeta sp. M1]RDG34330.1 hypothetical protein DV872_00505 [Oceanispirochaeta sp. M1]